jgi:RHS repeat-associated protein
MNNCEVTIYLVSLRYLPTFIPPKHPFSVPKATQIPTQSYRDYYPFGMEMPGRSYEAGGYRFGFNGKEDDPEAVEAGSQYDYGFRIYNTGIGRFLSVDPLTKSYPWYTPYQFAGNTPIWAIDLDGLEQFYVTYAADKNNNPILTSLTCTSIKPSQNYPIGSITVISRRNFFGQIRHQKVLVNLYDLEGNKIDYWRSYTYIPFWKRNRMGNKYSVEGGFEFTLPNGRGDNVREAPAETKSIDVGWLFEAFRVGTGENKSIPIPQEVEERIEESKREDIRYIPTTAGTPQSDGYGTTISPLSKLLKIFAVGDTMPYPPKEVVRGSEADTIDRIVMYEDPIAPGVKKLRIEYEKDQNRKR